MEHKLGLYADNILLFCTFPPVSVAALLQIIEEYSRVSYYTLNRSKLVILPLNNPPPQKATLSLFDTITSLYYVASTQDLPLGPD